MIREPAAHFAARMQLTARLDQVSAQTRTCADDFEEFARTNDMAHPEISAAAFDVVRALRHMADVADGEPERLRAMSNRNRSSS